MKTLRFFWMALLALFMCVNFASCSDDDEPFSVVGKTYSANAGYGILSGKISYYNLRFLSETEYEFTIRDASPTGAINGFYHYNSTYTIEYPKIILTEFGALKDREEGTFIDENTIRLGSYEFIKQ